MTQQLAGMRVDYPSAGFDVGALAPTWHEQLAAWLVEAQEAGFPEVNAMVLATAGVVRRELIRALGVMGIEAPRVM